ncbi:unnamed protein product [Rhizoctonia solani]|uniref:Uncharacterized protein n=1 Tax=Rhizoctonia solani TaxID=456999 RepID=A0A8H2W6H7_9AGAM|nr:unnamed protein product [Rhizoctonia solani]
MLFATHLDTWLIASIWVATNSFGFNAADLGISSYWVIPLANVVTLFHHGYLFRNLRRGLSPAVRPVYENLLPLITLVWLVGGALTIWTSAFRYGRYSSRAYRFSEIASIVSGIFAVVEAILLMVIWNKCSNYKPTRPPRPTGDFGLSETKV